LAALGFLAMILAATSFPEKHPSAEPQERPMAFKPILLHGELRPIFIATFVLSFALNLFFFTYPLSWTELGLEKSELWKVYLIIFLLSVVVFFRYIRRADNRVRFHLLIFFGCLSATLCYTLYLIGAQYDFLLYASGAAFFFGYSLYHPILPAFL